MSAFSVVKTWFRNLFDKTIEELFDVKALTTPEVYAYVSTCLEAYQGNPYWLNDDDHIVTVNFAKSVCAEVARLATMNIDLQITGSARAEWLNAQKDQIIDQVRAWVEYGCAAGTIILKPNGDSIDLIRPENFRITSCVGGQIRGIVFFDYAYDLAGDRWFTRLEYHRFENYKYVITNKTYVGSSQGDLKRAVAIETTPWVGLAEEVIAEDVTEMLFGVLVMPSANNIDFGSGLGLPIFADALVELKDLDVAYSRNAKEIRDSKRLVLLDSDRLLATPGSISMQNKDALASRAGLPDYIKAVDGTSGVDSDVYHEINPNLNTDTRLSGINSLLCQIGFKCGFSNGYFVFNEKTGMVTATQVESDDRRTIQLIADVRKKIEQCFDGLIYALDKFADAYGLAPRGKYEISYDFQDLTLNEDEDKARWYSYVVAGKIPFWYYLTRFEGIPEDEAKELESAANEKETLFGAEE